MVRRAWLARDPFITTLGLEREVIPVSAVFAVIVILVILGIITAARSLKVVQQYEKGVIYRFGQVLPELRGPGLHVIRPVGDRLAKVNMQIVAMAVPAQDGITRDNVSVRVDAVVYVRVVDPIKATVNVQNYMFAISQQAQTSLRSIIGQSEMDQLLAERESVNRELRRIIDEPTEGPWGIRVERVELKDVSLPEQMKRSMSRQAEAERERRARIITADGEYQASKRLAAEQAVAEQAAADAAAAAQRASANERAAAETEAWTEYVRMEQEYAAHQAAAAAVQEAEQHAATEASHQAAEAARQAEDAARRKAEEQARRVAAEASRAEAEQDARRQAEQAGRADAEEQAGRAAEERARCTAEEAARLVGWSRATPYRPQQTLAARESTTM